MQTFSTGGFICKVSYRYHVFFPPVGAVIAGMPISLIAKYYDWHGAFIFCNIMMVVILVIKILARNLEYKFIPIKKKMQ